MGHHGHRLVVTFVAVTAALGAMAALPQRPSQTVNNDATAQTADCPAISSISPSTTSVTLHSKSSPVVTWHMTLTGFGDCHDEQITDVVLMLCPKQLTTDFDGECWRQSNGGSSDGAEDDPVQDWVATHTFTYKSTPGYWRTAAWALMRNGVSTRVAVGPVLHVVRNTRFASFDASPEPVVRGHVVHVRGQLRHLARTGRYVAFAGALIYVRYRPADGTPVRQRVVTTDRDGWFSARFTVYTPGWFRAQYYGFHYYAGSTSTPDYVAVARR